MRARKRVVLVAILAASLAAGGALVVLPKPPPADLTAFVDAKPKHGKVAQRIPRDGRTGLVVTFMEARARGAGAENLLTRHARSVFARSGDEGLGSLYWPFERYEITARSEEDSTSIFVVKVISGREYYRNGRIGWGDYATEWLRVDDRGLIDREDTFSVTHHGLGAGRARTRRY